MATIQAADPNCGHTGTLKGRGLVLRIEVRSPRGLGNCWRPPASTCANQDWSSEPQPQISAPFPPSSAVQTFQPELIETWDRWESFLAVYTPDFSGRKRAYPQMHALQNLRWAGTVPALSHLSPTCPAWQAFLPTGAPRKTVEPLMWSPFRVINIRGFLSCVCRASEKDTPSLVNTMQCLSPMTLELISWFADS